MCLESEKQSAHASQLPKLPQLGAELRQILLFVGFDGAKIVLLVGRNAHLMGHYMGHRGVES
jgi:hypothetical protein